MKTMQKLTQRDLLEILNEIYNKGVNDYSLLDAKKLVKEIEGKLEPFVTTEEINK